MQSGNPIVLSTSYNNRNSHQNIYLHHQQPQQYLVPAIPTSPNTVHKSPATSNHYNQNTNITINSTESTPSISPQIPSINLAQRSQQSHYIPKSPSILSNHQSNFHEHAHNHRMLSQSCPNTPTINPFPQSPQLVQKSCFPSPPVTPSVASMSSCNLESAIGNVNNKDQLVCKLSYCKMCDLGSPNILVKNPTWACVMRVVFYCLKMNEPSKEYFNLKTEVYGFMTSHWKNLCINRKRSDNWKKQIQDMLSHSKDLFESGMDHFRQNGYWKLKQDTNPWEMKKEKLSRKPVSSTIPSSLSKGSDSGSKGEKRKRPKEDDNDKISSHQLSREKENLLLAVKELKVLLSQFNEMVESHKTRVITGTSESTSPSSSPKRSTSPGTVANPTPPISSSTPTSTSTSISSSATTNSGEERWCSIVAAYQQLEETYEKLNSADLIANGEVSPKSFSQPPCSPLSLATPTLVPMQLSGESQSSLSSTSSSSSSAMSSSLSQQMPSQLNLESSSSPHSSSPTNVTSQEYQLQRSMSITTLIQEEDSNDEEEDDEDGGGEEYDDDN